MVDRSHTDKSLNEHADLDAPFPQSRDLAYVGIAEGVVYEVIHVDHESGLVWINKSIAIERADKIVPIYRLHPYKDPDLDPPDFT